MQAPMVSIVVPVFNVEKYIAKALNSCISQTLRDIEIIVVDDCGQDKSIKIAQKFAKRDTRIKVIHHPTNLKLLQARISGVLHANSSIIMFLDADDFLDENACKICFEAMGGGVVIW